MLVAIGFWFTAQQDARQQQIENQRAQQAQKIENRRAEAERELAEQRAQDEALQAYLNQMSQLMLDRKLLEAEPGDPAHTLAQARTSTVILRLDSEHNESVTRFLIDSGLAASREGSPRLLREITLSHATLSYAVLRGADLSGADLSNADLSGTLQSGADLSHAYLDRADLSCTWPRVYCLTNEEVAQQAKSLNGATMPNGQKYEDWLKSKGRTEHGKSGGSS
jgi:hypothetical protein